MKYYQMDARGKKDISSSNLKEFEQGQGVYIFIKTHNGKSFHFWAFGLYYVVNLNKKYRELAGFSCIYTMYSS